MFRAVRRPLQILCGDLLAVEVRTYSAGLIREKHSGLFVRSLNIDRPAEIAANFASSLTQALVHLCASKQQTDTTLVQGSPTAVGQRTDATRQQVNAA